MQRLHGVAFAKYLHALWREQTLALFANDARLRGSEESLKPSCACGDEALLQARLRSHMRYRRAWGRAGKRSISLLP